MMKNLTVIALVGLAVSSVAWAQTVPSLINYQGRLTQPDGQPYGTANYGLEFNIYDGDAPGGSLVWGPLAFPAVPVVNGYFNVFLGPADQQPSPRPILDAFTGGSDRWLQVTVGEDPPLLPRQRILSAPYAIQAAKAAEADEAAHAVEADNATNAAEADNADTLDEHDSGYFAESVHDHSLEDLGGAVTDAQVPNDITISQAVAAIFLGEQGEGIQHIMTYSGGGEDYIHIRTPHRAQPVKDKIPSVFYSFCYVLEGYNSSGGEDNRVISCRFVGRVRGPTPSGLSAENAVDLVPGGGIDPHIYEGSDGLVYFRIGNPLDLACSGRFTLLYVGPGTHSPDNYEVIPSDTAEL